MRSQGAAAGYRGPAAVGLVALMLGLPAAGETGDVPGAASAAREGAGPVIGETIAVPAPQVRASVSGDGIGRVDPPAHLTEGAAGIGATAWQRSGLSGAGVKVAVVDIGFDGYRSRLGTELPGRVEVRSFRRDGAVESGSTHGTAAAEILHDIAPGAELHLIAFDYDLWSVVDYLITNEIDVVSFSIGYLSGPFDGSSPIARAVQWALDEGIVWVTAAGNYAQRHWGGVPADGDHDGWIDITSGVRVDPFTVAPGADFELHLSWLGDADLDLCLYEVPAEEPIACASGV